MKAHTCGIKIPTNSISVNLKRRQFAKTLMGPLKKPEGLRVKAERAKPWLSP